MKKVLFGLTALFALVAFMAAPAAADLKLTSKGYFQVQGMYMSGNPGSGSSDANDWYNMEMIVEPVLHINDKVRIFSSVRIMERNYSGTAAGDLYATDAAQNKYNVFGNQQNNFWVERLYMNLNLFNGDFRVGRMSGGNWAHEFSDTDQNRDRLLYIGKPFGGNITFVILPIEKRDERDGGQQSPTSWATDATQDYTASDNDQDAYAFGLVIPIGKIVLFRPLWYGIRDGQGNLLYGGGNGPSWTNLSLNGLDFNFGNFKIETEFDYAWGTSKNVPSANGKDIDFSQWVVWGEASFTTGPFMIAAGGFWIQGDDTNAANNPTSNNDRIAALNGTGNLYEPTLLMFSEDMGFFYASTGVPNGSFGTSGYQSFIARGSYKLTDTMKLTAVYEYLKADQMKLKNANGKTVDDALGNEFDLGFQWKFMPNVSYLVDAGYFWAGDYFKDRIGDNNDVYGVRNTIRVEW